jgi:hypothetical protein
MFSETRIAEAFETYMTGIDVPPVPIAEIRRRIQRRARRGRPRLYLMGALAATVALVVALPRVAPGFAQTIEQQIEAVLRWTPPPPAPAAVESAMRSHTGDLGAAQSRVDFTIVPPEGLPKDVVSERVATTPTGVYSKITRSWSVGSPCVWFVYRRAGGGSFMLLADRFDPREGPPAKYVFEDLGERNGHELLVRHENIAWRNGQQITSAVAGEGISAAEIASIRSAMRGIPYDGVWPPQRTTIEKQYRLP